MDREYGTRWFVDRREGDWWLVSDGEDRMIELPAWLFPLSTNGGDVLDVTADDLDAGIRRIVIRRNDDETAAVRREAETTIERLRGLDPGGDLNL